MKKIAALFCAMALCVPSGWGTSRSRTRDQQPEPPAEAPDQAVPEPNVPQAPEVSIPDDVPDLISVPAGTHVPMTIVRAPQESQAHEGAVVYMRTRVPVRVDEHTVIPARTLVVGMLSSSTGFMGAKAGLSVRLHTILLPHNYRLPVSGRVNGTVETGRGQTRPISPMNPIAGFTPEQLAAVGSFAVVGSEIGLAMGKNPRNSTIGALVGAGIGVATIMAMNGARLRLNPGNPVDAVLDEPLALDPRYLR